MCIFEGGFNKSKLTIICSIMVDIITTSKISIIFFTHDSWIAPVETGGGNGNGSGSGSGSGSGEQFLNFLGSLFG